MFDVVFGLYACLVSWPSTTIPILNQSLYELASMKSQKYGVIKVDEENMKTAEYLELEPAAI